MNESKSGGNKINLSNLSISKKFIGTSYLIFRGAKKCGDNPKKGGGKTKKYVKAAKSSDYLTLDAKKAFNYLRHLFI